MAAAIERPVGARPWFTVITGLAELNCKKAKAPEPVTSGVVEKLSFVEIIGLAELRMTVAAATVGVPRENVGVPEPPSLMKVRL
jgi:hypothetical protein